MQKARLTRRESYARRLERQSAKAKAEAEALPDEPPRDMDKFRNDLARRINRYIANRKRYWCGCKEPACRRQRACMAPHIHCSNSPPRLPSTPAASARAVARVQRSLREAMARQEGAGDARRSNSSILLSGEG